jgi:type VI secretion system secreted protein Hcp
VPTETVIFQYGAIKIEYKKQAADGTLSAAGSAMWSRVLNKATDQVK